VFYCFLLVVVVLGFFLFVVGFVAIFETGLIM
jgi:hypothetical protein